MKISKSLQVINRRKKKGGKKSDKRGLVTQMMPQVEMLICLMEQNNMVVGGIVRKSSGWRQWSLATFRKVLNSCDSELRSLREPSMMMTARQSSGQWSDR